MSHVQLNIDGGNPLAFLAAVGAVVVLSDNEESGGASLEWSRSRRATLSVGAEVTSQSLGGVLHQLLHRAAADPQHVEEEVTRREEHEQARRQARRKMEEIKKRKLAGNPRKEVIRAEHEPLAKVAESFRQQWLAARRASVPDVVVSLGLNLTVPAAEFATHASWALDATRPRSVRWMYLCSAFGAVTSEERMAATPFALIKGDSHQHFLGTAGELMTCCTAEHITAALFGTWTATDEGCSFRWDPGDDRRYALLAMDPTASGNKPRTLWGANRLAFEALRLFPCMVGRRGFCTVGWRSTDGGEFWRWPLWDGLLEPEVIRSLLADPDLWTDSPAARRRLRERGVSAVYELRRVAVGSAPNQKLNFSPSTPVW